MIEYYGNNDYRDYLMHYGVKGMKWRQHLKKKFDDSRLGRALDDARTTRDYNRKIRAVKKRIKTGTDRFENASLILSDNNMIQDKKGIYRAKNQDEFSENERINRREITRGMNELRWQGRKDKEELEKLKKQRKFHKQKKRIN